jgi:hypothetical protein
VKRLLLVTGLALVWLPARAFWGFAAMEAGFNFEEYDSGTAKREPKVNEAHLRELFENGRRKMMLKQAAERLQEIAEVGRSAAYEALKLTGRFAALLARDGDGLIGLRPATGDETESGE